MNICKIVGLGIIIASSQSATNAMEELYDEDCMLSYKKTYVMRNWDASPVVPSLQKNEVPTNLKKESVEHFSSDVLYRSLSAPGIFIFTEGTIDEIPLFAEKKPAVFLVSDFAL